MRSTRPTRPTASAEAPEPEAPARTDTKTRILDAAFQRLAREGYAALSVREIARDAGVNYALINYHFESKDRLVIAVLDRLNERLLDRQQRMYLARGGFAGKWAQARRFYENDLASGFVRVLMELYAASMSNEPLREEFRPRINAWFEVINTVAREAVEAYGLDLPPEVIGCWISNFWMGMELSMLAGTASPAVHRQALDAFEAMLRRLDAQAAARSAPAKGKRGASAPRR
jgi:AcrR family transcriptional regulator